MLRTVAEYVAEAAHAGRLDGAASAGKAVGENSLVVEIGLWLAPGGQVERARYRVTTCPALIAYAEAACGLAESVADPETIDGIRLRSTVAGVHPVQRDRADLVALALSRALDRADSELGAPR